MNDGGDSDGDGDGDGDDGGACFMLIAMATRHEDKGLGLINVPSTTQVSSSPTRLHALFSPPITSSSDRLLTALQVQLAQHI
jgi:hypothetical protein